MLLFGYYNAHIDVEYVFVDNFGEGSHGELADY